MIRPVALAIVLALVGCQSADVQRAQPTLTIPAAWRADVGPASPVEGVWWRNFHDSTLNQYVDQALRYNSDVLIARERVNEYQARAYAADSSLFPSLDASLTGTRARTQSAATGQRDDACRARPRPGRGASDEEGAPGARPLPRPLSGAGTVAGGCGRPPEVRAWARATAGPLTREARAGGVRGRRCSWPR